MYQFQSLKPQAPKFGATAPPSTTGVVVNNLLTHVPTEAVAFVTVLSPLINSAAQKDHLRTWLVTIGALALSVLVRWLNNASLAVWCTTLVAFALWMCLVPSSAAHLLFPGINSAEGQIDIAIVAAFFSAVVTALASAGRLK
jgi:hypothetical protein